VKIKQKSETVIHSLAKEENEEKNLCQFSGTSSNKKHDRYFIS